MSIPPLAPHLAVPRPGMGFQEVGRGIARVDGEVLPAEAHLRMTVPDRDAFVQDPRHLARAEGTFKLGDVTHEVEGSLSVMQKKNNLYYLVYDFASKPGTPDPVHFSGAKEVWHDKGKLDVLRDLTVVHGRLLHAGDSTDGIANSYDPTVQLQFPGSWPDYLKSFQVPGGGVRNTLAGARDLIKVFTPGLKQYAWPFGRGEKQAPPEVEVKA